MTLTPEEALREALEPWPTAALDADRIISRLEPRGYRLTPIEINEAAVERAIDAYAKAMLGPGYAPAMSFDNFKKRQNEFDVQQARDHMRAAIVAYLEGAK